MPYLKAFVRETHRLWPNNTEIQRFTGMLVVLKWIYFQNVFTCFHMYIVVKKLLIGAKVL